MPTPEAPRPPEMGMARVTGKGNPGQQMGRMTGLAPLSRGGTRARRVSPAAGETSGVVLTIDTSAFIFDYDDWVAGSAPNWTELDSWGPVSFSWAAHASYVTCPPGLYAVTVSADIRCAADRAMKVSMEWSGGPGVPMPGPGSMVYGPNAGSSNFVGSGHITGLRDPELLGPVLRAYDLATGTTPATDSPEITAVLFVVVRLSD